MVTKEDPLRIIGRVVAEKYLVEAFVGAGGFSVVYRATHTHLNRPVALKLFSQLSSAPVDQRDALTRDFIQEGALLTELSSETAAIVQARDAGSFISPDGAWLPYLVLEWLDGVTLETVLERERLEGKKPWSVIEALRCLGPIFGALHVAHRAGVTHRDIKPANVFVVSGDPRSGEANVKLLDFGVAKLVSDRNHLQASLARTGTVITSFTPQYGAPEQFSRSYGATGPWTDVFALALVLVELLTGGVALDGEDIVQLAFSASNPNVRPTPRHFGLRIPDALEAVFLQALAPSPADRYPNAGEFWAALDHAMAAESVFIADLAMPAASRRVLPRPSSHPENATTTPARRARVSSAAPPIARPVEAGRGASSRAVVLATVLGLGVALAGGAALWHVAGFGASAATEAAAAATPPAPSSPVQDVPKARPRCPEDMAFVPAGQFFMGSDEKSALPNEKPSHNVTLDAFCMDLKEVTAGGYKACSDVGKCRRALPEVDWPNIDDAERKAYVSACTVGDPAKADHPMNCITWELADAYCRAHSRRLPTEAEWEYATRGPDGRVYPWGDEEPTAEHLNACGTECVRWGKERGQELKPLYEADDGYPTTAPVGTFRAGRSRFGPYDVVGNVWEWVADWYGDYDAAARTNPSGPETGKKRVIRGGAWNGSYATWLRPSFRYAQAPEAKSHGIGFRCAAPAEL